MARRPRSWLALGLVVALWALRARAALREVPVPPDDEEEDPIPWDRLTVSSTADRLGLDNTPTDAARARLAALWRDVLAPIRAEVGAYRITSGYRSPEVNAAVSGSSSTSQHMTGEAADLAFASLSAVAARDAIAASGLPFDQAISYARKGHVHVSYREHGPNRREVRHDPEDGSPTVRIS